MIKDYELKNRMRDIEEYLSKAADTIINVSHEERYKTDIKVEDSTLRIEIFCFRNLDWENVSAVSIYSVVGSSTHTFSAHRGMDERAKTCAFAVMKNWAYVKDEFFRFAKEVAERQDKDLEAFDNFEL